MMKDTDLQHPMAFNGVDQLVKEYRRCVCVVCLRVLYVYLCVCVCVWVCRALLCLCTVVAPTDDQCAET